MLALLENGCRVTIIDNFDNAFEECFARMQRLAGDKASKMMLIKVLSILLTLDGTLVRHMSGLCLRTCSCAAMPA